MFWIKYISYHKRTSYFKAHMPISTCLRIKMSVTAYLICSSVAGVELCQTQNLPQPPLFYYSTIVEYYFFFFFFNNAKIEANTLKMVLVLFCLSHPTSRHIWDLYFKEVLSTEFIFVSSVHSCTTDFKAYCFHSNNISNKRSLKNGLLYHTPYNNFWSISHMSSQYSFLSNWDKSY